MSDNKPVPTNNSRKAEKYRAAECQNCGHPLELSDRYCSYCSQLNSTKNISLKDFFGEFIGSIITYDSRFRYTLKDLLFRPGTITRNYVNGQRLKYANPFRFFLSVSIIYFILQSLISTITGVDNAITQSNDPDKPAIPGPTGDNFKLLTTENDSIQLDYVALEMLTQIDSTLKKNNITINTSELDSILKEKDIKISQKDLNSFKTELNRLPFIGSDEDPSYDPISEEALDTMSWPVAFAKRSLLYYNFYKTTKISEPVVALDSLKHQNNRYNRWAYSKNESFSRIEKKPGEFFQYLVEKTPFFLFFFTPIYAFFFWLLYSRKKYTYMEHMVFIFHIFSFVFLVGIICLIPDALLGNTIFFPIFLAVIAPFYFYKALRNFYMQNRLITIIKFIFLNWIFWIGATIMSILFFTITAAMY